MSAFLIPVLIRLALDLLVKIGAVSGFDAALVKAGTHVLVAVKGIKTYSNNDQLNPANSDFAGQIHNGGR